MKTTTMFTRRVLPLTAAAAAILLIAACGNANDHDSAHSSGTAATSAASGHGGHSAPSADGAAADGLASSASGLTLSPASTSVAPGQDTAWQFTITGADGKPVTQFHPEQTQLMHLYVIRDDLTGFQHLHPTLGANGTWTAPFKALQPGKHRVYTQFTANGSDGKPVTPVLSVPVNATGIGTPVTLPTPANSTTVDGYTIALEGKPVAGKESHLALTITRDGKPVTDLEPYLESYAHVTALHAGDLAFAHLHPHGKAAAGPGGPKLELAATLPKPGDWRLYVQFQTGGTLHTAAITVRV